jgi:signal transduction histidine kinase
MFKPAHRSLRIKFSLTAAFILLFIFTFASVVRIIQNTKFQKESLIARSETFAALATTPLGDAYNLYHNSGILKLNDIFRSTLQLNNTVPHIQIISVNGEVLFDSNDIDTNPESGSMKQVNIVDATLLQAVMNNDITKIKDANGDISEIVVPYSDNFGSRPYSMRYFISYTSINASINQAIFTTVILNIILFLATLAALTFLVNRSILSPLAKITKAAQAIGRGDLEQNIAVTTRDELDDLAVSLNLMTTTLKNNIYELKKTDRLKDEFITIASHNLRTPLTIIKGFLPSLKEKNMDKESLIIVDSIAVSVQKLYTITESLLNIVSLERTKQPLTKKAEDIGQLIRELVAASRAEALKKNITFSLHVPEQSVLVMVDLLRIRQAFANVIDNAIKFNKQNGLVTIDLATLNNEVILSVSDTGIGITPEEINNIFQRFHRGTDILTYNYEGIGLGLYLSRVIIEAHAGKIGVTSTLGEGTNVNISLPINA